MLKITLRKSGYFICDNLVLCEHNIVTRKISHICILITLSSIWHSDKTYLGKPLKTSTA